MELSSKLRFHIHGLWYMQICEGQVSVKIPVCSIAFAFKFTLISVQGDPLATFTFSSASGHMEAPPGIYKLFQFFPHYTYHIPLIWNVSLSDGYPPATSMVSMKSSKLGCSWTRPGCMMSEFPRPAARAQEEAHQSCTV